MSTKASPFSQEEREQMEDIALDLFGQLGGRGWTVKEVTDTLWTLHEDLEGSLHPQEASPVLCNHIDDVVEILAGLNFPLMDAWLKGFFPICQKLLHRVLGRAPFAGVLALHMMEDAPEPVEQVH